MQLEYELEDKDKQLVELKQQLSNTDAGYKSLLAIKETEHTKLQEICYQTIQQRFHMRDEDINKIIIKNTGNNWYSNLKTSIAQECLKRRWVNFWLVVWMVTIIMVFSYKSWF